MKYLNCFRFIMILLIGLACIGTISGCETGKEVIDEATGNRAVKQYHKSKKNIEKAAQRQAQKYKRIQEESEED